MKYYIVISPQKLMTSILKESKEIQRKVYSINGTGIFFRVKTVEKLDNPRRLFLKGDGRIVEVQIKPHLSLVHNIELEDSQKELFIRDVKAVVSKYNKFYLNPDGVGNYNQDFTFFLKFKPNSDILNLRKDLLQISKRYLLKEEYKQHTDVDFIPHITILYDDVDPKSVEKSQILFKKENFKKPILIDNIQIWQVTPKELKAIKSLSLK